MAYAIDLFCGAGGMSEGLLQAGFDILFSNDLSKDVQKTYMNRHEQLGYIQGINTYFHQSDIRDISGKFIMEKISELKIFNGKTPPKIDAIFGGPPCQGFSRAGLRSKNDPRNLLFKEYLRIIKEIKPNYVVMENVLGLLDMKFNAFVGVSGIEYEDGTITPDILNREFSELGYNVQIDVLNAADFGVPQRRNRVIILANLKEVCAPKFPEPDSKKKITIDEAIGDLNGQIRKQPTKYQLASKNGRTPNIKGKPICQQKYILNNELSTHSKIIKERFSLYREGEDSSMLKARIMIEGINLEKKMELVNMCCEKIGLDEDEIIHKFKQFPTSEMIDILLTKKNMRKRLDRKELSPTVVTLPDDYISPYADRIFSVRELARLQSFDDSFEFLGKRTTGGERRKIDVPQYSQVGNAVPPLLAKAIACEVLKVIKNTEIIESE